MMLFVQNFWYVYILYNNTANWVYVGLHHHVGNKPYTNSSSSVMLQEAIDSGNISEYIVWKGVSKEKAHALETYLINLAKDNGYNLYNKNSGGGHAGASQKLLTPKDYEVGEKLIVSKIFPKNKTVEDEKAINEKLRQIADEVKMAVINQAANKKKLSFRVVYEPIDKVLDMKFLQIRENAVDQENVDRVIESMLVDLKAAETLVEPVSVVVMKDGSYLRVDGTTSTYAIKEINEWKRVPVVYLPASLFDYDEIQMEAYATLRNRPEKHKGANNPKKELKARIANFYAKNKKLFKENVELFQEKFMNLYRGSYSDRSMLTSLSAFIRESKERDLRGENWFDYSVDSGTIISELSKKISTTFNRAATAKIAVNVLEREGTATPLNYFGNVGPTGKDIMVILAHHSLIHTEHKEEHHLERLKRSLEEAGFYLEKKKKKYGYVPFVSKTTGKKIFVIFLPCRIETKTKKIDADTIFNLLFDKKEIKQEAA